jgi:hypothetical protein
MARHKQFTKRRRSYRKTSRKMRGGLGTSNDESQDQSLHLSELNISGEPNISNNSNILNQATDWENSGFSGNTTINSNDWSIGQENLQQGQPQPDFGNIEEITPVGEGNNFLDVSDLNLEPDEDENLNQSADTTRQDISGSFGGKRKYKRRTTNKRKTKKSRKTRKHRKRRQRGGAMTTSVDNVLDNDEQEYIDYKKLMSKQ